MKISNETKIGLLAALTIIAVFWGYKFLKNESVLDKNIILNADFDDAEQITTSSPVFFHGVTVGTVKEIKFRPDNNNKATLILLIKQNPGIPKNAQAILFSNGVLSGKAMQIVYDKPCAGGNCAVSGDFLQGASYNMLQSMIGTPEQIDPYVKKLTGGVNSMVDTLSMNLKKPDNEVGKSLRDIQQALISLKQSTETVNKLLAASSENMKGTFKNLELVTRGLASNNDNITGTLNNVKLLAEHANTLNFGKINGATDSLGLAILALKQTLSETQNTLKGLTGVVTKVSNGEGTFGQLTTNDSVYKNLNLTLIHTEALMQDLRLNPKRYINFNPFRRYKQYVVPAQDPLIDSLQKRYNATLLKKN